MIETPIKLVVEIPEDLYVSLTTFLETHSALDREQVLAMALSWFLVQEQSAS
jgi:hypothetical protein